MAMESAENQQQKNECLLNLCFFKFDVLLHNRVVLLENEFFSARAWVLLGDVEEASASRGKQFDFLGDGLSHNKCLMYSAEPHARAN
jgi:hypothetical protein